jgi:hypothetical protein
VLLAAGALWLVSAVDRRTRGGELRSLRLQGLAARTVARAGRWGYLGVVLAALVLGPAAAALAWAAVGDRMPIFVDEAVAVRPPDWPRPDRLLLVWLGAALVLMAISLVVGSRVTARPAGTRS